MAFGDRLRLPERDQGGRATDRALTILALIGISLPVFWLAEMLLYYLTFKVRAVPERAATSSSPRTRSQWANHLILPWITLAVLFIGFYSRVLRSNMLDVMDEDYVRTARAKGLPERQVRTRHVLRNSLIPIVTLFGLDFGAVIGGGAILTETVYNLTGRRALRRRGGRQPRPASADRDDHVRRLLHRPPQHPRRHRLRLSRSADPARGRRRRRETRPARDARPRPLLAVEDLQVELRTEDGVVQRGRRRLLRSAPGRDPRRSSASRARARASPRRP